MEVTLLVKSKLYGIYMSNTLRRSTRKGRVKGESKELSESGIPETDESAEEEESMDYSEVLVTSGRLHPNHHASVKTLT